MTRVFSLAVALCAALALGACAGEGGQLATSPETPTFQTGGVGPACSLTDLRKATSALFGSRHAANDVAKQFTSKNVNQPAATAHAYNLFAFIEAKRATAWVAGDPEKGAELTLQIIACSDVAYTDNGLEGTANLANARAAFILALDVAGAGTYAVRGGGGNGNVVSKNLEAALDVPGDISDWLGSWRGGRSLVIGYTIPEFASEANRGVFYDWSMIRPTGSTVPSGLATISYCVDDANEVDGPSLRIQHHPTGNNGVILPITSAHAAGIACTNTASLRHHGTETFATRMVRSLFNVVRPAPLFASAVAFGPVSGTLGDFSPTAVVDPEAVILTFVTQPVNTNAGVAIPAFSVKVTGQSGTPWANVVVKLTPHTNNATNLAICNNTATTGNDGIATFNQAYVTKPGGVYFTASTIEPGIDPDVGGGYSDTADSSPFTVGPGSASCQ